MLTQEDKDLLAKKGISEQQIAEQLACFEKGFPFLKLFAAASVENRGIMLAGDFEKKFFNNIKNFAFYADLDAACVKNNGKGIEALISEGNYKAVVANLLESAGLNYGALPKGLLKFHKYEDGVRTPLEEHLVEGALYAAGKSGEVNVHFTVSTEHRELFAKLVDEKVAQYAAKYGVKYNISFSEQKPSTAANFCSVRAVTAH